jgi:glycosyltransferase involved in cell wall biosynthesis
MGKRKKSNNKSNKIYPLVSVCTPTFNRRPFIENMINCYKNQTYPRNRMEWIIVDDGTDKVKDIFDKYTDLNIKYFAVDKMHLGAKRNFMHTKTEGSIIVYMDDDDYYPPERVEHSVDKLTNDNQALCAGSSEIYVYFKEEKRMIQCGPYSETHATAGTFAFKRRLLDITSYEADAALAEERHFLKNYTIPFVQLDPLKTILVFSHKHNTFNKREMLKPENKHSVKNSDKTVESFIKFDYEKPVKEFFIEKIDSLLQDYEPGLPENKPEVLKQTKELKIKREKMKKEVESDFINADTGIRIEQNGENKSLTRGEIVGLLKKQQEQIKQLSSGDRGFKIEFVPPNGEPKQLTVKELVELAQKQFNTILVQNNIINQMRNQLKELEKK